MKSLPKNIPSQTKPPVNMSRLFLYGLSGFGLTFMAAAMAFVVLAITGLSTYKDEPGGIENVFTWVGALLFIASPVIGTALFIVLARASKAPQYTAQHIVVGAIITLFFTSTVVWIPALLNYQSEKAETQLNERQRQARNPVTRAQLLERCKTLDSVTTRNTLQPYAKVIVEKGSESQVKSTQRIMNRLGLNYEYCIDGKVLVDTALRNHQTDISTLKSYVSQINNAR